MRNRWALLLIPPLLSFASWRTFQDEESEVRPSVTDKAVSDFARLLELSTELDAALRSEADMRRRAEEESAELDSQIERLVDDVAAVRSEREDVAASKQEAVAERDGLLAEIASLEREKQQVRFVLQQYASWLEEHMAPRVRLLGENTWVERLEQATSTDAPSADLFRSLWLLSSSCVALGARCEATTVELELDGTPYVLDAVRIGLISLIAATPDRSRVMMRDVTDLAGGWVAIEDSHSRREISRALDVLSRRRAPGRTNLPISLGAFRAPPPGPDFEAPK